MLRGDPGRLRQVLTNLLGNALKFTDRGEVVLRVSVAEDAPETTLIRFEVADTGVGIPEEALGHLFAPFSQGDSSTTRKYGGTGLGLAISKRLTELMGGRIEATSQLGQGSTFAFTARLERTSATPVTSTPPATFRGVRALIVDDNTTNRLLLRQHLTRWGMVSEDTASAAEALTWLRRAAHEGRPFGLALLDLEMPEMSGADLGRVIRTDPALVSTRVVLLTSWVQRADLQTARDAGTAYVTKPVRAASLLERLTSVLAGPVAAPAARGLVAEGREAPARPPTRARILVAEDNSVNQRLIVRLLEKRGYVADVVANGREVLDALVRVRYDLILMDCQMPEMDGFEATRAIRLAERGTERHVPIIALTANAMAGDQERCLAAGMDDYLAKPVTPDVLYAVINRLLAVPTTLADV
jgi:CheY-like chemotaxis protein